MPARRVTSTSLRRRPETVTRSRSARRASRALTGTASSLSDLVVAIAAVRRSALTLAVADVIGGNTFDALIAGIAYRGGSIYHRTTQDQLLIGLAGR